MKGLRLLLVGLSGLVLALAVLMVCQGGGPVVHANTLCVAPGGAGGCYASIQAAVKAAAPGDTIRVAQGTYLEAVQVTKTLQLEGGWNADFTLQDWTRYTTTIDAQRAGPVIRIEGIISPTLEGFLLTGGDASANMGLGGGVRVYYGGLEQGGTTTLKHNVITNNLACAQAGCLGQGGGVHVYNSTLLLDANTLVSNTACAGAGGSGQGGGLYIDAGAQATLAGNSILNNTAGPSSDSQGGGVYAGQLTVAENNTVADNAAARGGGVYLAAGSHALLRGNLILRNHATATTTLSTDGGGGLLSLDDTALILGNRLLSNTATNTGGGVLLAGGQHYQVSDNTLQGNTATFGGGLFATTSSGALTHNWLVSNTAAMRGGGVYLYNSASVVADANQLLDNAAVGDAGGGLCIQNNYAPVAFTNHRIARNSARVGGGVFIRASSAVQFINNTVVDNNLGSGQEGLVILTASNLAFINNLVVGHSVALSVTSTTALTADYDAFFDNQVEAQGVATGTHSLVADPLFLNRAAGDYHLGPNSPLVDRGSGAVGVPRDFEGDPRPCGSGIDIGADEVCPHVYTYLPILHHYSSP